MFERLKEMAAASKQAIKKTKAAPYLREYFEKLELLAPESAERLAGYVVSGEDQAILSQCTAVKGFGISYIGAYSDKVANPVSAVLDLLPQDPQVYLRLAMAIEAASKAGSIHYYSILPGLQASSCIGELLGAIANARKKEEAYFPASLLEAVIRVKGDDPAILVRGAFMVEDPQGKSPSRYVTPPAQYYRCLSGFAELALRHPDVIRRAFAQKEAHSRALTAQTLLALNIPIGDFRQEIAALAVSNSKEVREAAETLLANSFADFSPLLKRHAESGSADERFHAVRLLAKMGAEGEREFLRERLEADETPKVVEQLQQSLASSAETALETDTALARDLPPVPEASPRAPLDRQVLEDLRKAVAEYDRAAQAEYDKQRARNPKMAPRSPVRSDLADELFARLQDFIVEDNKTWDMPTHYGGSSYANLQRFAAHPQFQLIHLVRWCLLLMGRNERSRDAGTQWQMWLLGYWWSQPFLAYQKARKKPIDLRELAAVFRAVGLDDRVIGCRYLEQGRFAAALPIFRHEPSAIWPYFAERIELLRAALGIKQPDDGAEPEVYLRHYYDDVRRDNAFRVLSLFPHPPASLSPVLWEVALSDSKSWRHVAQVALERFPNKEQRAVSALTSPQKEARAAAAEWLADLNYHDAIPQLRSAVMKEKSEDVKDAMFRALERLGVELAELLDVQKLRKEAEKGLAKGIPAALSWFPFEQLPAVHWAASGQPVDAQLTKWFLVQNCKLNNPEPGPLLRRYCSLFDKADRSAFGNFVLDSWIAHDTKPKHTPEQAAALAAAEAKQVAGFAKQYPKYYPEFDEHKYQQAAFNRLLVQPEGSAISSKGILAVAAACCAGDVATVVHRYVKQWYGYRPGQCKALLQMLAWVDDPSAVQVVLSVANRFRTKGIQEEAMRQCHLLSERRGWTLDQLSDRTIPAAGLDEKGEVELDYGSRKFSARLTEDWKLELKNAGGKVIASLPDANQGDTPEMVKLAKATLSSARKELKTVLTMQKERLYEALCTQRTWIFGELKTYLFDHPIVGRFCQRLVWVTCAGEEVTGSFRPMPDGTLTNYEDEAVSIAPEILVRLAHDVNLPEADRKAWLQHFADYKVEPLFQQFGKAAVTITEQMKEQSAIDDFEGHLVKAFALRNRLTRLGYTRGQAQDGGWFFDYHKTFPRLGLEAVIEFTGNGLPEQDRTVALLKLSFRHKTSGSEPPVGLDLTLGELPPILVSECWNDIRMAAADGTGYAPDWEKQAEF